MYTDNQRRVQLGLPYPVPSFTTRPKAAPIIGTAFRLYYGRCVDTIHLQGLGRDLQGTDTTHLAEHEGEELDLMIHNVFRADR